MLHPGTSPSSTLWLDARGGHGPFSHRSARLFLCARCRDQVLLCSQCDRGQQYCSRACSSTSRRERRREAAQRYQSSRRGRRRHAARTACWRRRRRTLRQHAPCGANKVTHQGCPDDGAQASLLACDTPSACESIAPIGSVPNTARAAANAVPFAALVCQRCAQPLPLHVRLGYLRPSSVRLRRAMTIAPELAARIVRLYKVEHWRVGTIARQLNVHRDTVRRVPARTPGRCAPGRTRVAAQALSIRYPRLHPARRWRSSRR